MSGGSESPASCNFYSWLPPHSLVLFILQMLQNFSHFQSHFLPSLLSPPAPLLPHSPWLPPHLSPPSMIYHVNTQKLTICQNDAGDSGKLASLIFSETLEEQQDLNTKEKNNHVHKTALSAWPVDSTYMYTIGHVETTMTFTLPGYDCCYSY